MELTSSAFKDNGNIPSKYTCDGDRTLSPPLTIAGVPEEAKSLALIMEDIDVPKEKVPSGELVHWIVTGVAPTTTEVPEGVKVVEIGAAGMNGKGSTDYFGPCPPPEYEPSEHRYVFKLYALSRAPNFVEPPTKDMLLKQVESTILEVAELIGRYRRIP